MGNVRIVTSYEDGVINPCTRVIDTNTGEEMKNVTKVEVSHDAADGYAIAVITVVNPEIDMEAYEDTK